MAETNAFRQFKSKGSFERTETHTLQHGVVVLYRVVGFPFAMAITRDGVQITGTYPNVQREGVEALIDMLHRAVLHHEHLNTFPVGTRQTTLSESDLDRDEMMRKEFEAIRHEQ